MSLVVETTSGQVLTQFDGHELKGVEIGEYNIPLEPFSIMAVHFLGGGFFGWPGGVTPDSINTALTRLFGMYEKREDGTWARKLS